MPREILELKEEVLENPEPEQLRTFGDIYGRATEVAELTADADTEPQVMYVYI